MFTSDVYFFNAGQRPFISTLIILQMITYGKRLKLSGILLKIESVPPAALSGINCMFDR